MNEEEQMPTYGNLYAENFRLEHNNRVLQQRIDKAIEYIEHEKFGDKYGNFFVAIGEDSGCPKEACEELLEILKGDVE